MAPDKSIREFMHEIDKRLAVIESLMDVHATDTTELKKDVRGLQIRVYGISFAVALTVSLIGLAARFLI